MRKVSSEASGSNAFLKNNLLAILVFLLIIGGVLNHFLSRSSVREEAKQKLKEAYVSYVRGETAKTLAKRQQAFNKALFLYSSLEKEYAPKFSTGKLYYNLGNSYFQLSSYPLAIYYYHLAAQLMPRNEKAKKNLQVAQKKLGFETIDDKKTVFEKFFFFYTFLSLPEKLQIFFLLAVITLISSSFFIWQKRKRLKQISLFFGFLTMVMLLTLGYHYYIASVYGILMQSTPLYREAGKQYAKVVEVPLLSGMQVKVLNISKEGKWIKIATPDGHLGFIPENAIRVIN